MDENILRDPILRNPSLFGDVDFDTAAKQSLLDAMAETISKAIAEEISKLALGGDSTPEHTAVKDLTVKGMLQVSAEYKAQTLEEVDAHLRKSGLLSVAYTGGEIAKSSVDVATATNIWGVLSGIKGFEDTISTIATNAAKASVEQAMAEMETKLEQINATSMKAAMGSFGALTASDSLVLGTGALDALTAQLTPIIDQRVREAVANITCQGGK